MEPHSDRNTSTLPSPVPVPRASMPARAGGGEGLSHYLVTLSDGTYAIIGARADGQARRLAGITAEARGLTVLDTSSVSRTSAGELSNLAMGGTSGGELLSAVTEQAPAPALKGAGVQGGQGC